MSAREIFDSAMQRLQASSGWMYLLERDDWFSRTHGSAKGAVARGYLRSLMAVEAHEAFVNGISHGELDELERRIDEFGPDETAYIRRLVFSYRRATRLPRELVQRRAAVTTEAQAAWQAARAASDFSMFAPHLKGVIELVQAEALAYGGVAGDPYSLYDALLQSYEPEFTTTRLINVLERATSWLPDFLRTVRPDDRDDLRAAMGPWPVWAQQALCRKLLESFGFDFAAGGFDTTVHPFCSTVGPDDVQLTTRFAPTAVLKALSATAHECGHGLFDQAKPELLAWGMPSGFIYSLGIHETQSRLWQNHVFGSRAFWEYFSAEVRDHDPQHHDIAPEYFYRAVNMVRPSLIRVDADELTYNLHILIRVRLEIRLLSGQLSVKDLPQAWNDSYEELLGIRPANDAEGVLQDVHWSSGSLGYFGTYTLGNLGAAQQFAAFTQVEPQWQKQFRRGVFGHLKEFLGQRVYPFGHTAMLDDLIIEATGRPLAPQCWIDHIRGKFGLPETVEPDTEVVRTGSGTTAEG
ncbi:MAG: carboxypeptidase M32 [Candidatus Kerfeldbacteria bacterium]|nr:carboxypeptidase M32 [Candidatus Kerfeldbacteria bacterium]